ncbi:MAG: Rpn family recombination-promoting nuclease/putative transposase, partial [Spirochaetaceae bacterium]|nr:Rpn family recombination-promoting nuclease/putative transposase [Spirochaetaceae bacterium]
NDFAFRKALGEKGDEVQLMSFLNAVLERTGKNSLESVEILDGTDVAAAADGGKSCKLDVLAKLADGSKVNIEVQNKNERNIAKRSLFYWSKKYTEDLRSGDDYIELVPVIGINITGFGFGPLEDFHTSYHLREDRNRDTLLTDVCEIHILDMVKFRKSDARYDTKSALNRWLTYFDERSTEEQIKEVISMDSAIRLVQENLDMITRDPALLRAYEGYEKAERDYVSGINAARREGMLKGVQQGIRQGIQQGVQQGIQQGALERDWELARKLKADGVFTEQIARWTGLSEAQIREL